MVVPCSRESGINANNLPIEIRKGKSILLIKALPGSRRNEFRGVHDGRLRVCVTQVAEKGRANRSILHLLSKTLGVSKSQLEIVAGTIGSEKTIEVSGIGIDELKLQLKQLVGSEK